MRLRQDESGDEQEPLVSIGEVVARLKADYPTVSASSLRFLERIGLVVPSRTQGGHRLYRPSDVARIRTIKRLQDERYTLEEIAERLGAESGEPAIDLEAFLDMALAGDAAGATHLIAQAIDRGMSQTGLFDDVLAPVLREVGERWAAGAITVAQEHAASEVIRDLIAVVGVPRADAPDMAPEIVAAAVAGERHVIGLQMISTLLRLRGCRVHFLGADVDPEFLTDAVRRHDPDVVLLSATTDERLPAVEQAIETIRNAALRTHPAVVFGGQVARRHAERLALFGAVVIPEQTPGASVEQVLRLLTATPA
jgi:methanogenic corrinoid protein MtbC1